MNITFNMFLINSVIFHDYSCQINLSQILEKVRIENVCICYANVLFSDLLIINYVFCLNNMQSYAWT